LVSLFVVGAVLLGGSGKTAHAQQFRVDVGGGWAFPTNNVELSEETTVVLQGRDPNAPPDTTVVPLLQDVDLKASSHVYAGVGVVFGIGENFQLGTRLRGHLSQLQSSVDCRFGSECGDPDGRLTALTLEARLILTSLDRVKPYLLVGAGVVHTSVDGTTLRNIQEDQVLDDPIVFPEVSILDAGGDVGLGATFPVTDRFSVDAEIRVTGSLPGGKENTVTTAPFTLGVAYTL
jgi:opacity protein-like surface antigen